jgi:hypothetical protein
MRGRNLLLIVTVIGMISLVSTQAGQSPKLSTVQNSIFLEERLREIGDKFDRYFTIETGLLLGNRSNSIEQRSLPNNLENKNLAKALEQLRDAIPNLTFKVNRSNPKIIHITDARLSSIENYAMEKVIDDLSFEGTSFFLVGEIRRKGASISGLASGPSTEPIMSDLPTLVRIDENNKKVRDLLSNFLSLKERGRVLWIARTELAKGQTTYIRFLK